MAVLDTLATIMDLDGPPIRNSKMKVLAYHLPSIRKEPFVKFTSLVHADCLLEARPE